MGKNKYKCRRVPAQQPDEIAVKTRVRRLASITEQQPKLLSKRGKLTRTGVDHAWYTAISKAAAKSSEGKLLSPRLPCGTKRPPLEKRVRSKWCKKILKTLEAKVNSNRDEFKQGESANNLGRPPRPLNPGRRQSRPAKAKELERQLYEKAMKREKTAAQKCSTSAPKQQKVIVHDVEVATKIRLPCGIQKTSKSTCSNISAATSPLMDCPG